MASRPEKKRERAMMDMLNALLDMERQMAIAMLTINSIVLSVGKEVVITPETYDQALNHTAEYEQDPETGAMTITVKPRKTIEETLSEIAEEVSPLDEVSGSLEGQDLVNG